MKIIIVLYFLRYLLYWETKKINEDQSLAVEPAYNLDRVQRAEEPEQSRQEKEEKKNPANKKNEKDKKNKQKKAKQTIKEGEKKSRKQKKNGRRGGKINEGPQAKTNDDKKASDNKGNKTGKKGRGRNKASRRNKKDNSKKFKVKKTKKIGNDGKNADILKQTDTCYADLLAKTKKFVLYFYQSQKLNRITSWVKLAQNKKAKALSTFSPVRDALGTSTNQGTSCARNSSALAAANTTYTTLVSCNTTASTICDVSLNATSDTLVTSCTTSLATYIADFRACLKTGACSCFQGLEEAGVECEDFLTLENQIKAEKNDCINPDKKGSFGNCRQEERLATTFTVDCCASYAVTTLAPGRRHMRLMNQNKLFHN